MKRLLKSKLTQIMAALAMIAVAIVTPLSGNILHSHAASPSSKASTSTTPPAVSITAPLDQTVVDRSKTVTVQVHFDAANIKGTTYLQPIQAVELLLNGISVGVNQLKPPQKTGVTTFTLSFSSLPTDATQAQLQARIYTVYIPPQPHSPPNLNKPVASSAIVTVLFLTLITKQENVDLNLLQVDNIPLTGLTVSTLLSEASLSAQQTSANVTVADANKGQLLFIADTNGNPFVVDYIPATDIKNGTTSITSNSIADGFIMSNPLMFGFVDSDRQAILTHAKNDPLYQDLNNEINSDLQTEPYHLLAEAIFPKTYEDATLLIINAIKGLGGNALAQRVVKTALGATPNLTIGNTSNPNLVDLGNDQVQVVNPTMVFYGFTVNNGVPHVMKGKDSLWQLRLGWPPAQFTSPVTRNITFSEGKDTVNFSKFGLDSVGLMGSAGNLLHSACIVLDALFWCPVSNDTIASYVEQGSLVPTFNTLASAGQDIVGATPQQIVENTIDNFLDPKVWPAITKALYASATDKAAAISFLKGSKIVLESAKTVFKILNAYTAANVTLPFLWDVITKPNSVQYCATETNGVLSTSCQLAPPNAVITVTTPIDQLYAGNPVAFDASSSTDPNYSTDSLMVRWDFQSDGIYDTDWSTTKTATWTFNNEGIYDVTLQVKNQDGLIGQTEYTVIVNAVTARGTATHLKVFRDVQPWQTTSFETTMANDGYTEGTGTNQYEILPSSNLASEILTPGTDLVVIMNDQDQTFYNNLAAALPRLDRFIQNGGSVLWEAADQGWNDGSMASAGIQTLPGGVTFTNIYDETNNNVNPSSILMNGLPDVLTGTYASHEHFTNLPQGAITYMTDTAGFPTLAEYHDGNGWVMLTGQPLEYNVVYNPSSMGLVYPRLFNYVLGQSVNATTQGQTVVGLKPHVLTTQSPPPSHIGN